jgi:hypothetical protein
MPGGTLKLSPTRRGRPGDGTGWRRLRDGSRELAKAGVDVAALAGPGSKTRGLRAFVKSWNELMETHDSKRVAISQGELSAVPLSARNSINERTGFASTPRLGGAEEASPEDETCPPQAALREGSRTRREGLAFEAAGIYFDYSKNRITDETLGLLFQLGPGIGVCASTSTPVPRAIRSTPPRSAQCCMLPCARRVVASIPARRPECRAEVHAVLDKMADFSDRVRSGAWKGHTGKRIRNVINVGIGGSGSRPGDGLRSAQHYSEARHDFRFVSNVDGSDFAEAVQDLDPAETLFIISSKTFTTLETMTNAHTGAGLAAGGLKASLRRRPSISSPFPPMPRR